MRSNQLACNRSSYSHPRRRQLIDIRRRRSIARHVHRTHRRSRCVDRHGTRWSTHAAIRIVRINLHIGRSRRLFWHRIACLLIISRLSVRIIELRSIGVRVVVLLWRRHMLYLSDADRLLLSSIVLGWRRLLLGSLRVDDSLGFSLVALSSEKEEDSEDDST